MKIRCVACWLDPDTPALRDGQEVVVIYDGNGYCFDHWRAALGLLEAKANAASGPLALTPSQSLPLELVGLTRTVTP